MGIAFWARAFSSRTRPLLGFIASTLAVALGLGLVSVFVSSRFGPSRDDVAFAEVGTRLEQEARALEGGLGPETRQGEPAFAGFERDHVPPRVEVGPQGYRVVGVDLD